MYVCISPHGAIRLPIEGFSCSSTFEDRFFQITNFMHNSFIFQQYVCYTAILNMFRAARCSSSGGQIVSPQPLVSSPSVNSCTSMQVESGLQSVLHLHTVQLFTEGDDTRGCGDTICPPSARNMLRIAV